MKGLSTNAKVHNGTFTTKLDQILDGPRNNSFGAAGDVLNRSLLEIANKQGIAGRLVGCDPLLERSPRRVDVPQVKVEVKMCFCLGNVPNTIQDPRIFQLKHNGYTLALHSR